MENYKSSIKNLHEDGIELAYAQENFEKDFINNLLMIRNPNAANVIYNQSTVTPKMKNNTILIIAVALLSESISVITD